MQVPQQGQQGPGGWHADPWGAASWRWWDPATGWSARTAPADPGAPFPPMRQMAGQTLELDPKSAEWHRVELTINRGVQPVARLAGVASARVPIEGHCAEGSWAFVPQPYDEWEMQVLSLPAGQQIATFQADRTSIRGEAALTFGDGRRFRWLAERDEQADSGAGGFLKAAASMMGAGAPRRWQMVSPDGRAACAGGIVARGGMNIPGSGGSDCTIVLAADAPSHAELPLLVLAGHYFLWRVFTHQQAERRERVFGDD